MLPKGAIDHFHFRGPGNGKDVVGNAIAQNHLGTAYDDALRQPGEVLETVVGAVLHGYLASACSVDDEIPQHSRGIDVPQGDGSPDGYGGALLPDQPDGFVYDDHGLAVEGRLANDDDVPGLRAAATLVWMSCPSSTMWLAARRDAPRANPNRIVSMVVVAFAFMAMLRFVGLRIFKKVLLRVVRLSANVYSRSIARAYR